MKIKVFFWILLLSFFSTVSASSQCNYSSEVSECLWALNPREIEDFVCTSVNRENTFAVVSQVILDVEFRKIDREVEMYIEFLEKNKNYYFWPNAKKTYVEAVDDIYEKFDTLWYFGRRYNAWCSPKLPDWQSAIVQETLACMDGKTPAWEIKDFFNNSLCENLVATKLDIYKQVSFDVLKLNKSQIKNDTYKSVMQDQRGKYDRLIDLINVNLNFIERIWARVPYLVKDAK